MAAPAAATAAGRLSHLALPFFVVGMYMADSPSL